MASLNKSQLRIADYDMIAREDDLLSKNGSQNNLLRARTLSRASYMHTSTQLHCNQQSSMSYRSLELLLHGVRFEMTILVIGYSYSCQLTSP